MRERLTAVANAYALHFTHLLFGYRWASALANAQLAAEWPEGNDLPASQNSPVLLVPYGYCRLAAILNTSLIPAAAPAASSATKPLWRKVSCRWTQPSAHISPAAPSSIPSPTFDQVLAALCRSRDSLCVATRLSSLAIISPVATAMGSSHFRFRGRIALRGAAARPCPSPSASL